MTNPAKIVPVILSGGAGSRLWPLSRSMRPKQFINLVGDYSLFQQTVTRLAEVPAIVAPVIICNQQHRFMVAEQMQQLGLSHNGIILEPVARNTAPAIATAAAKLAGDAALKNCVMLVLPSDHLLHDTLAFSNAIGVAAVAAQRGNLVTFGIKPANPATGYGYIKAASFDGATAVEQFVEKPDLTTAESYLAAGGYYWNSGMFMVTPALCIAEFEQHAPTMYRHVVAALDGAVIDLDFLRLEQSAYQQCQNISVDYAIMERSDNVQMVPLNAGWSDIGSWTALAETGGKDAHGNVTRGDVWLEAVNNSYIHAENKLVSAVGVDDLIIVETHDVVVVTSKQADQDISKIVERLARAKRPEVKLHRQAFRPWGNYDCLDSGERFQVKRIMVKPGASTSMQKHYHRAEHWIVVCGTAEVTCGEQVLMLSENQAAYIPLGTKHRLRNPGKVPLEIIEVQSGAYLGEDDIERFDDQYGRA